MKWLPAFVFLLSLAARNTLAAAPSPDLWDDSRYLHVADVKPGMVGYGLTVFSGTKIEKFNVTVIDVLKNLINPKCDVVLISCTGGNLEHDGPVEGMSGSPIYLYNLDDTQHTHPRMIGAFAYGWEWAKDPIAGVQPIEYMLKIPTSAATTDGAAAATGSGAKPAGQISGPHWSLADVPTLPGFSHNAAGFAVRSRDMATLWSTGSGTRLRPLATPIMAGGFSTAATANLAPMFAAMGMDMLQVGGSGQSAAPGPNTTLEPGSVLVAPLLTGDAEMSALGTCTEVRGNRVFAFGHDFNNEGPIHLPMAAGTVSTIIADTHSSFKLGAMSKVVGTLTGDQTVGVAGLVGTPCAMVPITLRVHYVDGSLDQTYHCQAALHPTMTPVATIAAIEAAVNGVKKLPTHHTLDYNLTIDFVGGKSIHINNRDADGDSTALDLQVALPILAASENPFEKTIVSQVTGDIQVSAAAQSADITAITLSKLKYFPGEDVKAFVIYRPWRRGELTMPFTFELPHDIADGDYQLIVSDSQHYLQDEMLVEPFRFSAENIGDLFAVLSDFEAIRHDALYVRLLRRADGVAVGRQALPRLPASMRQALLVAGRSDLTQYITSSVKTIPTDLVMSGAAGFSLTIDHKGSVTGGKTPKPATRP
jgi:hypothetical protein